MNEYEVVVEQSKNVCQLVRDMVEETVYHSPVSNSIVFVVRTSYIERLYDALNQTGLTYRIEEL